MKVKSLKLNMVLAEPKETREKMTVIRELSGETLSPEILPNITEIPSNNLKKIYLEFFPIPFGYFFQRSK